MSFRVFEVTDDCYNSGFKGRVFSEMNDEYFGNEYGVTAPYDLNVSKKKVLAYYNIGNYYVYGHIKPIGRLIIKEVK